MRKFFLIIVLLFTSACSNYNSNSVDNENVFQGSYYYFYGHYGEKREMMYMSLNSIKTYVDLIDKKTEKNVVTLSEKMAINTSSGVKCIKGSDGWSICHNNNDFYDLAYMVPNLVFNENQFELITLEGEPFQQGIRFYLINENLVEINNEVKFNFKYLLPDLGGENSMNEAETNFGKINTVERISVPFSVYDLFFK